MAWGGKDYQHLTADTKKHGYKKKNSRYEKTRPGAEKITNT